MIHQAETSCWFCSGVKSSNSYNWLEPSVTGSVIGSLFCWLIRSMGYYLSITVLSVTSVCLAKDVHLCTSVHVYLSGYLSVCQLSKFLLYPFICLSSWHLFISLLLWFSVWSAIYLSPCLSVNHNVHDISIYMFICPSVCLIMSNCLPSKHLYSISFVIRPIISMWLSIWLSVKVLLPPSKSRALNPQVSVYTVCLSGKCLSLCLSWQCTKTWISISFFQS